MDEARGFDCGLIAPSGAKNKDFKTKRSMKVKLELPFVATDLKTKAKGTWTMIYDEGLEIRIGGKKYFAYFKFKKMANGKVESTCSSTNNGYVHRDDRTKWGCFKAKRRGKKQTHVAFPPPSEEEMTKREAIQEALAENPKVDMSADHPDWHNLQYRPETDYVNAINALQTEWTAKVYPQFEGKTLHELQQMAGGRSTKSKPHDMVNFLQMDVETSSDQELKNMLKEKHANADKNKDKDHYTLPDKWDWRNAKGQDFMLEAIDQGSCGSCYAVAVADMITARVAVQTNNTIRKRLAPQEIIDCGEKWNQGCDGGFPYLASKYVADFGLASEDCYAYAERGFNAPTGYGQKCKADKLAASKPDICKYRVKANKYNYIGGCYGCCNEKDMMKEIYENGPIVIGFQVNMGMLHYSSGVFLQTDFDQDIKTLNPWEETNHAVVVVGWGTSPKGTKYWTVKNSWGKNWGDKGYFYVQRGTDEMAFESMAVAAVPQVTDAHHITSKLAVEKKIV